MKPRTFNLAEPWTGLVALASVIPNPDQPRKHFDEEKLVATAKSLGIRQIQAINVIPHTDPKRPEVQWMIVDGERRWRALRAIGRDQIKITYDPDVAREHLFEASFAANFCREGHTRAETVAAVGKLLDAGKSQTEIAEMVGKTASWANDYAKLRKLHPQLLKAMDFPPEGERKLPMNVAKLLADLPPFDQLGQWNKHKDAPVSESFHKIRTSGKVRHGAKRDRADDAEYAEGKASATLRSVEALVSLPLPMLKSLTRSNITAIQRILARIGTALDSANARFKQASKEAED